MNIEPSYVSFEQAKLLKKKRFNEKCETSYYTHYEKLMIENNGVTKITPMHNYSRAEQWQVVEWLRVNHGIWIQVSFSCNNKGEFYWYWQCKKANNNFVFKNWDSDNLEFNSPQEAYSAAFDYILKELL